MRFQVAALLLIFSISPCLDGQRNNDSRSQESPRQKLEKKGLRFSPADFIEAVRKGDIEAVDLYLAAGISPDTKDASNVSALLLAIGKRHAAVVHALIAKGADTKKRFRSGATLLTFAAMGGSPLIVQDLLAAGADLNDQDLEGRTILIYVGLSAMIKSEPAHLAGMQGALPKGLEVNELFDVPADGYAKTAELLLSKGANPNAQTEDGQTALMYAAQSGDVELVKTLLNKGADPTLQNRGGFTALQLAISLQRTSVIELLKQAEADKQ